MKEKNRENSKNNNNAEMNELNELLLSLHELERKVLPVLDEKGMMLYEIAKAAKLGETETMRAVQWLSNKNIAEITTTTREIVELDANGRTYAIKGLPERRFLESIKNKEARLDEITKKTGLTKEEVNVCLGVLKKKAAVDILPGLKVTATENGKRLLEKDTLEETFLKKIAEGKIETKDLTPEEKYAYENFKKRRYIIKTSIVNEKEIKLTDFGKKAWKYALTAGITKEKIIDRLTPEMLRNSEWKNKNFRKYDLKINVPSVYGGKRHFTNQAIEYIKKIWLELGFKEMEGNMIQTAFWDLDSLFVPQDHPARQMQDSFYLGKGKIMTGKLPAFFKKIKEAHENGGDTGSRGWETKWSEEEAKKIMLRTHTTVLSSQTIASLKKEELPKKFFSVNKVFRNEALDWKHLFEFYQVEGIVIDPDANLKHLKGYLREFFGKMGYKGVRIRPAHFPYTEPSVEVEVLHPIKKEWVELGGAGIFRPEVVKPLLGIECPVLAWGLGMERIIVEYYKITDLRDLYRNDLKQIKEMKTWMKS